MTTVLEGDDLVADPNLETGADTNAGRAVMTDHEGEMREQLPVAALVIAAMSVFATSGFGTIFATNSYLLAALGGATLGALVVVLGRRMHLLFGEIVGLGLIAPMIVGPLVVGGTDFFRGLVFGWADILSATPPVDPTASLKALPFIAAFVGALAGTELFRIRELPGLAIVGPLATMTLTALFSEQTRNGAITVGLVLLVGMLVLTRLLYASLSSTGLLILGFVLVLVGALASLASVALPYADEERRFDLRDLQTPPWEPLSLPSPMTSLKQGLSSTSPEPLLRIRGDVPVNRWRIVSLPAYSGEFWGLAERGASTDFVTVGRFLPDIADEQDRGDVLTFDVDILGDVGQWVPTGGVPRRLEFSDPTDIRMSIGTGTLGSPTKFEAGNSYELMLTPWVELDDTELARHGFVSESYVKPALYPAPVGALTADFVSGTDPVSGARVMRIRDQLRFGSYELDVAPSHNFGTVGSFVQLVTASQANQTEDQLRALVGNEEVYTATGALMVRTSDIPVRVAVGYVIPDDRWADRSAEVFESDMNAWIEVHIEGRGWMPIDVTPDRDRTPEEVAESDETQSAPVPQPPDAPLDLDEDTEPEVIEPEPTPEPEEEEEEEPEVEVVNLTATRVAVGGAIAGLSSLLLLGGGIAGYKFARRRRRRRADAAASRIAGAWAELVDRVDEAGGELPAKATPAQAAFFAKSMPGLEEDEIARQVQRLADHVSVAAFHPDPPPLESAEDAWLAYDEVAGALKKDAGAVERLRRVVDPRTLREEPVGTP